MDWCWLIGWCGLLVVRKKRLSIIGPPAKLNWFLWIKKSQFHSCLKENKWKTTTAHNEVRRMIFLLFPNTTFMSIIPSIFIVCTIIGRWLYFLFNQSNIKVQVKQWYPVFNDRVFILQTLFEMNTAANFRPLQSFIVHNLPIYMWLQFDCLLLLLLLLSLLLFLLLLLLLFCVLFLIWLWRKPNKREHQENKTNKTKQNKTKLPNCNHQLMGRLWTIKLDV